jgi:hypothetical protein
MFARGHKYLLGKISSYATLDILGYALTINLKPSSFKLQCLYGVLNLGTKPTQRAYQMY